MKMEFILFGWKTLAHASSKISPLRGAGGCRGCNNFFRTEKHPPSPPQGGNTRAALATLAVWFIFTLSSLAQTLEAPYLSGHVNDYAHMLSQSMVAELEATLKTHEDSTSNQVAVLIIPSLEGAVLEEYSIKVVETWKLGRADKDNGALLLIARDDRKVRIEVGNGLEGDLPDITCGRIIRNEIVPRFKDGDYEAGVRDGVHAILAAIQGSYVAPEEEDSSQPDWVFKLIFFGIFMLVVGVFTVISIVTGGGAGWFLYFFLMPFWLAFPMVSFGVVGGGILFGLYVIVVGALKIWMRSTKAGQAAGKKLSKKWAGAQLKRGRGGSWASGSSWSSSSWGSSSWGGSSGGGFSGGGGSFSGGGASGSW